MQRKFVYRQQNCTVKHPSENAVEKLSTAFFFLCLQAGSAVHKREMQLNFAFVLSFRKRGFSAEPRPAQARVVWFVPTGLRLSKKCP